jgi:tetratricopeptide (TPR) repeat protein
MDRVLEKMLNPLPDFDPFEKPPETPLFFPDETDKRARELMIDALTNRQEAVREHLRFFRDEDARRQKQPGPATGLTNHAQDLVNNTIADREGYLAAQRRALKNASSLERKKYLEAIINQDDLTQSNQLMRQSTTNFWGGMTNRMLNSIDLVGVASGNYIGAAVETAISQLYALADRDMPMEERRALARDLDHLKRYPDDPRNAEIRSRVDALDRMKRNALARKQIAKAGEAAGKMDFEKARFHAEIASFFDPESEDAKKALEQALRSMEDRDTRANKALLTKAEPTRSPDERRDVEMLLAVLTLRDAKQLERLAVDLDKKYRDKPMSDAAKDAEAVALEMRGRHEEAKKIVAQLARTSVTPDAGRHAATLLQSREYNLLAPFHAAQGERRLETVKYVLLGEDLLRKNLLYAAGAMAAAGPAGAATLGTVNAILLGSNLYQVMTNNPVSAQPVIDAGVSYVRNHPNSSNSAEVYKVLADSYEERGMFDRAIAYHELAGAPQEKVAAVKEKAAKALLNAAAKAKDRGAREYYLTSVVDQFAGSPTAAEATKKLAEMAKDENQGLRMSKQFLMENPEIYGPRGFGLKASLFDGDPRNMEIAGRGVNLVSNRELLVYYQTPWGVRSQSYSLSAKMSDRFFVQLRDKNQQVALADVNQRAKGSIGGIQGLPATVLRAQREKPESKPNERDNTTFTLVREADGRSYPRVLDHELLSENERNPGSAYKLPPIQGSISASRFSMSGALPAGLWGNQVAVGADRRGNFAGVQLPIPLLKDFIPVDFMIHGRPGGFSVYPRIHAGKASGEDPELYR